MTFSNKKILLRDAQPRLPPNGDRDRFKELLRRRLIECGWREQVRKLCRNVVREYDDPDNVTFEMLVSKVTPQARALVPESVKRELIQKIKAHQNTQRNQ